MVDVSGHIAIALLFASPAWFVWGRRGSLTFVGFCLVTAMLPDVDLFSSQVVPAMQHHGVTHTVFFVSVASVGGGAVAARYFTDFSTNTRGFTATRSPGRRCSPSRRAASCWAG